MSLKYNTSCNIMFLFYRWNCKETRRRVVLWPRNTAALTGVDSGAIKIHSGLWSVPGRWFSRGRRSESSGSSSITSGAKTAQFDDSLRVSMNEPCDSLSHTRRSVVRLINLYGFQIENKNEGSAGLSFCSVAQLETRSIVSRLCGD